MSVCIVADIVVVVVVVAADVVVVHLFSSGRRIMFNIYIHHTRYPSILAFFKIVTLSIIIFSGRFKRQI